MTISSAYPNILQNGALADATQVMADFYQIQNDVNTNAAHNGNNFDIAQIGGLLTPLNAAQGGTGVTTGFNNAALTGAPTAPTPAYGTNNTLLATTAFVTQNAPPGSVIMWMVPTLPAGFIELNGANISRTSYPNLFAAWGVYYGVGDGSTTFGIPDMRGIFPRGLDDGRGMDPGRGLGTYQADTLASHTHSATVYDPGHHHTQNFTTNVTGGGSVGMGAGAGGGNQITQDNTTGIGVTVGSTGGTETRPKNLAVIFIVKY